MNTEEEIEKPKQKLSFSDLFFIEFIENNLWISCYLNPGFSYFTRAGFKIFPRYQFYSPIRIAHDTFRSPHCSPILFKKYVVYKVNKTVFKYKSRSIE